MNEKTQAALVSIILPLYKSKKYVRQTLESVQDQTHSNFEVVVVDDGSPDDSADLVESMQDRRFRIFRRPNTGSCRARNFGIEQARGDFIAFIDHDDLWLPEKLEKHLEHLERSPEVGLSYGPSKLIDENGDSIGFYQTGQLTDVTPRLVLCRNPIGNGSTPLIRRQMMNEVRYEAERGGKVEAFYFNDECVNWEDIELWIRMLVLTNWGMEGIPDCLTLYRITPGGITDKPEQKQEAFENGMTIVSRYAPDLIKEHGPAGRAYHLRYLARRMILSRESRKSIAYAHRALGAWPKILVEDPSRTVVTLLVAYLQLVLPGSIYQALETFAFKRKAKRQMALVG